MKNPRKKKEKKEREEEGLFAKLETNPPVACLSYILFLLSFLLSVQHRNPLPIQSWLLCWPLTLLFLWCFPIQVVLIHISSLFISYFFFSFSFLFLFFYFYFFF